MSVIGRLDDQVNEVLIAPLDRNRRPDTAMRQQPTGEPVAPSSPPGLHTPEEDESSQNEPAARDHLPVWLL